MDRSKLVLIADDSALIRRILEDLLSVEYRTLVVSNGQEVIDCIHRNPDNIAVLLLDLVMPKVDGFQVLAHMRQTHLLDTIPVIIITADESERSTGLAYDLGASEVIQKPFSRSIVKKRIHNIIELYAQKNTLWQIVDQQTESLQRQADQLQETNTMMIDTLSTVIEYRSLESGQHIRRIRGFTRILARLLARRLPDGLTASEIDMISSASAMHDIGKIAIPDSVLLKPGKLTSEEFEVMKTHTTCGGDILQSLYGLSDHKYITCCRDICLYHHERWDGCGYPRKLSRNDIPISAQIVSIADVFDALTHKRVYKDAHAVTQARDMIMAGECGQFSPLMRDCFIKVFDQFQELSLSLRDDDS